MSAGKVFKNTCKQILKDFENFKKTVNPDRRTKNYVSTRLDLLESNLSNFEKLYVDILCDEGLKEDTLLTFEESYNETKEIYTQYKSQLLDELDKFSSITQINEKPAANEKTSLPQNTLEQQRQHDVRLPKIQPPIFTGDYQNWRPFHDQFVSLVHNNKTLSNIEKLHYLKSCCKESAGTLLEHINVDEASYDNAWELLKSRYDFKRILVNNELKLFYELPVVREESAKGIRELLDNSTKILHALKNLDLPVQHWDAIIIFLLLKKLPSTIQSLWENHLGTKKEIPTFKDFSEFLETKFRTLEIVDQQQKVNPQTSTHKRQQRNVFLVNNEPTENFICKVCHRGKHSLRTCSKFLKMDVQARQRVVKQFGNCFNCLAYSHRTNSCPSNKVCHFCQRPHNSLLHYGNNYNKNGYNSQTQSFSHSNPLQHNTNTQSFSHSNQFPSNSNNANPFSRNQTLSHSRTHTHSNINHNSFTQPIQNSQNQFQSQTHHISTQVNPNAPSFRPSEEQPLNSSANCFHTNHHTNAQILLATAIVKVKSNGGFINMRALVDPGSQATFITESAAQILNLKKHRTFFDVSGLGQVKSGSCQNYVDLNLGSRYSDFEIATRGFIFKTLTGLLPSREIFPTQWKHIHGLKLADPTFYRPACIDLLLGNDVFCEVVLPEVIRGEELVAPIAQKTQLGWLILGKAPIETSPTVQVYAQFFDIDTQLRKFWEIEESPFEKMEDEEDIACEQHFLQNIKRLPGGRFEVSLPFKENKRPALPSTQQSALSMFYKQERRLLNNTTLHKDYNACISEYLQLNQMEEVDMNHDPIFRSPYHYVVPHHAVFKESSTTTKLRVVFNAAFKTSDGSSLNDHLMTGPKTQTDIVSIILRWRINKITFTADIEKMYRQIQIQKDDAYYQLLFWREDPTIPIKLFKVKVLMFGTAPAPYLANRTLKKLASDEVHGYPLAAQMIREDMYIDDLVSGADSLDEAEEKFKQISTLLRSAGFHLRKWMSNNQDFLNIIPEEDRETSVSLTVGTSEHTKTLGISWYPSADSFSFQKIAVEEVVSKRTILSTIARLYDPLGWISPCIIKAKIIMQQLWLRGLSWDETVPVELHQEWLSLQEELAMLEEIRIPRWIHTQGSNRQLELHGFSDASIKAYGAVVYLRVLDNDDVIHTHLLISKTRVAPLNTVSLPRLELCGAVVLAKLLNYILSVLPFKSVRTYAWTDSTITLCWIAAPPTRWKTFIGNRVAEIQRLTNISIWRHIPTKLNPADLASRGVLPATLACNALWWEGPPFLREEWKFSIPTQPTQLETEEEKREIKIHLALDNDNEILKLIHRHSNIIKLLRVLSHVRRFIYNSHKKANFLRRKSALSPMELKSSLYIVVQTVQQEMFPDILKELRKTKSSKQYKSLNLMMDWSNIIRIGGRLKNSTLSYDQRHPIILKPDHHFTKMILRNAHERTFHGGLQQMITYIRNLYWIFNIKRTVKKYIHQCVICYRYRPKPMQQLMGNLPAPRVNISRPFTHTGVDYAGPMEVKAWKGRGSKMFKGYFAIFICLATKAIHLEVVTDMTTQTFLAAFRRFTARRGICSNLYSDCGTNFKGANTELMKMLKAAKHDFKEIADSINNLGTKWNFIPPASPHFGGLWEAGVKSVKHHLKRITRNEALTFEELSTLLAQIEACLNSRPLCPLTDNFDDFAALTPAHFLIGTSSHVIPEADLATQRIGYIDRWKRLQSSLHTFWKEWSGEYLTRLQNRPKWLKTEQQPNVGDLVLLKDERLPPSKWPLARIIETYKGTDNFIRVVKVKTQNGELKRPITKICPLPSNNTSTEQSLI